MKHIFHHPEPTEREQNGARYWRSPEELAKTPEFSQWLEKEFPEGASEANDTDRRTFLKLMGASAGLAGIGLVGGCRLPEEKILPYSKQPENSIPGVPAYYASSWPGPGESVPLIVTSYEHRPTKIEGNPSYSGYRGATNGFTQASVLDLYDPDRLQSSYTAKSRGLTPAQVRDQLAALAKKYEGKTEGLALLTEPSTSPTRARLLEALRKKNPAVKIYEYAPVNTDVQYRALAAKDGEQVRPIYQFGRAARVLSLDSDFLTTEVGQLKYSKDFSAARKVDSVAEAKRMNRLYVVESNFTLTGGMADHRLRAATSHIPAITALVAAEIFEQAGVEANAAKLLRAKAQGISVDSKWVSEMAADLLAHKGEALIVAGPHLPAEVHQLVAVLNRVIGAEGKTIRYVQLPRNDAGSIAELAQAIEANAVQTLVILGGNPAYDAPADLKFAEKLKSVPEVIRWGSHPDETGELANTVIASTHYLESWGDGRTVDGTYVPVQPLILPLFEGFNELEVLALIAGVDPEGHAYKLVKETFAEITGKKDDLSFETWLAEGLVRDTKYPQAKAVEPKLNDLIATANLAAPALSGSNLEFRIIPSTHAYDGRYNNNGWLMECPDPMTKLTWENAILVSPKLAKELQITPKPIRMDEMGQLHMNANQYENGLEIAKVASLTVDGKTLTGPVHILPGLADYTIILSLGFGRRKTGRIGTELYYPNKGKGIGFDVYPFVSSVSPSLAVGGKIEILEGQKHHLANTQEHWSMEGRAIVREGTSEEFQEDTQFAQKMGVEAHAPSNYGVDRDQSIAWKALNQPRGGSAYKTPAFNKPDLNVPVWQGEAAEAQFVPPQQWGMNIDLNTCTACNACVIACQSENNIPIVGKDQVLRGREMHWIRLDRYFSVGPDHDTTDIPEDPQVTFMSMACQHCELAPCESVCPVNATVHDKQGLNVMAYNRCVGTRYCANNCPYKVRRFNFMDYNKRERAEIYLGPLGTNRYKTEGGKLEAMQRNPNVTVRMRGVMEKCTYCIQRIEMAKINQKVKAKDSADIHVPDGTIKTACQQVCAGDSITFGDISDESTQVYKAKLSDRAYSVLGYLNIRPRTTYSAKLRNPNPKMPDAYKMPLTSAEHRAKSKGGGH